MTPFTCLSSNCQASNLKGSHGAEMQMQQSIWQACGADSGKMLQKKKKKNHYLFSSQLRADQMRGPPREGQLMWTPFLNTHQ